MGAIRVAAVTLPRIICFYTPWHYLLFIPVTRRVKRSLDSSESMLQAEGSDSDPITGRRKRFRPHKTRVQGH